MQTSRSAAVDKLATLVPQQQGRKAAAQARTCATRNTGAQVTCQGHAKQDNISEYGLCLTAVE